MELSKSIHEALSKQMNMEMASAYLYLEMSYAVDDAGLGGFAHWLELQAGEEMDHAKRIEGYIKDRNVQPDLYDIVRYDFSYESPLKVAKDALEHEYLVSDSINKIVDMALDERDHATVSFLKWFVDEQVEEEETFTNLVDLFEFAGDNKGPLFALNGKLYQRKED